jgi:hypothetical protein
MRRITTIGIACFLVALSGAAVAIGSSGKRSDDASTTSTTDTTTTPSATRPRHLDGRVVTIDATAKTFDLRVRRHHGRKTVTIAVTEATAYKKLPDGFASIQAGYRLKVNVSSVDGALVASKVARKRGHRRSDDNAASNARHGNDDGPNHDANDDRGGNSGRGGDDH